MARKLKLCVVCRKDSAVVPDRNKPWSQRLEVCRECHRRRLIGDLRVIMRSYDRDYARGKV